MLSMFDEQVFETVKNLIEPNYLQSATLKLQENAEHTSYCSIMSSIKPNAYHMSSASHFFARVKTAGDEHYISFNIIAKRIFDNYGLDYEFKKIKSEDFYRMALNDFYELAKNSEVFKKALNEFFINSFEFASFGCCSKYKLCSELGSCQHEDIIYASAACQYKKNLDKGNNFMK
ncbi:MAG: hypothetical protein IJA02_08770 [Clostridia bacterium]|nr:hypothetical protein [Clostridia bacterium]